MSESKFRFKNTKLTDATGPSPESETESVSPDESLKAGLTELATLARQSFEEKRRKNCMTLTSAMLKIDPENKEALVIQGWLQSDLRRDLQQVFSLIKDPQSRTNRGQYERAQLVLQNVLEVDPRNQEAELLLMEVKSILKRQSAIPQEPLHRPDPLRTETVEDIVEPEVEEEEEYEAEPPVALAGVRSGRWLGSTIVLGLMALLGAAVVIYYTSSQTWSELLGVESEAAPATGGLEISVDDGVQVFVNDRYAGAAPIPPLNLPEGTHKLRYEFDGVKVGEEEVTIAAGLMASNTVRTSLGRVELLVVPSATSEMSIDSKPASAVPLYVDVTPGQHSFVFSAPGYQPHSISVDVPAGERKSVSAVLKPVLAEPPLADAPAVGRPQGGATAASASAALGARGTLAVSSPLPVEIFMNNKPLGSTPVTLDLPPGRHTLEYRYQDLRKTLVHDIESNQVTRATVTFEVTSQIDAQPRADVFLEGLQLRPLGQTPLNNIRLTVGSVLVFRNPDFPEKRYRVTGKDTSIYVFFTPKVD